MRHACFAIGRNGGLVAQALERATRRIQRRRGLVLGDQDLHALISTYDEPFESVFTVSQARASDRSLRGQRSQGFAVCSSSSFSQARANSKAPIVRLIPFKA